MLEPSSGGGIRVGYRVDLSYAVLYAIHKVQCTVFSLSKNLKLILKSKKNDFVKWVHVETLFHSTVSSANNTVHAPKTLTVRCRPKLPGYI